MKMFNEFQLPDGTVAESVPDVDRYLKESGAAPTSDYSDDFFKNRRFFEEKARRDKIRADFILNFKKEIWRND
jgi:hypothetical protein